MPALPAQPACGHHEDRCLISDPRVRVPVSKDPSVALTPQAGLPPCGWVSACVSSPQISPNVSPCALIPGQPSCPPLSPSALLRLPTAGTRSVTLSHEGLTCLRQGSQGAGQPLLASCRWIADSCHQGHVLSFNFCFYSSCRKQRLEIDTEASWFLLNI